MSTQYDMKWTEIRSLIDKHQMEITQIKTMHSQESNELKTIIESLEKELKIIQDKSQMTKYEKETLRFFEDQYLKSDTLAQVTI